jgi:HSP20 family molecular chaperone IbpA
MNIVNKSLLALVLSGLLMNTYADEVKKSFNDPFYDDFARLQKEMDEMFINFHKKYFSNNNFITTSQAIRSDFEENNNSYIITVNLPGYEEKNIHVKYEKNSLVINAKNQTSSEKKDKKFQQQEHYEGSVYQSFSLPNNAEPTKMKTEFKNGTLHVTVPKK